MIKKSFKWIKTVGVSLGQRPNNYWWEYVYGHAYAFFSTGYQST